MIASAGLDRFLRVHSTSVGQAALGKVYLKQQLTGVVWLRPPVAARGEEKEGEDEEEDGSGKDFNHLALQGLQEERERDAPQGKAPSKDGKKKQKQDRQKLKKQKH